MFIYMLITATERKIPKWWIQKIFFYCSAELMKDHLRSAHGYEIRIFLNFALAFAFDCP